MAFELFSIGVHAICNKVVKRGFEFGGGKTAAGAPFLKCRAPVLSEGRLPTSPRPNALATKV